MPQCPEVTPTRVVRTVDERADSRYREWSAGPTAVVLKQTGKMTYGALWNQVWSFSGNTDRADVNQMFLQPFVAYQATRTLTVTLQSEATANWEVAEDRWTVPINLLFAKLSSFGAFPRATSSGSAHLSRIRRAGRRGRFGAPSSFCCLVGSSQSAEIGSRRASHAEQNLHRSSSPTDKPTENRRIDDSKHERGLPRVPTSPVRVPIGPLEPLIFPIVVISGTRTKNNRARAASSSAADLFRHEATSRPEWGGLR